MNASPGVSQAAVFDGTPGSLELQEFALPAVAAGQILIRILGCTLCGSDLHSIGGRRQVPVPTILGHEIVGQIVEMDGELRDVAGNELATGDRLVCGVVASCGECFYCSRELPQKCLERVKYGHEPLRPGQELLGGLAEHMLLVQRTAVMKVPDSMPLEVACPAGCATATAMAAVGAGGDLRGASVCVMGGGVLGLNCCAIAKVAGAAEIVCVEPRTFRQDMALRFGATRVAGPAKIVQTARTLNGGAGFDVVLEVAGAADCFPAITESLRMGGTVVLAGTVFPAPPQSLSLELVVLRQLSIRGIHNYAPQHLRQAVEFLDENGLRFPFSELVAEWYPLSEIRSALVAAKQPEVFRVGVGAVPGPSHSGTE